MIEIDMHSIQNVLNRTLEVQEEEFNKLVDRVDILDPELAEEFREWATKDFLVEIMALEEEELRNNDNAHGSHQAAEVRESETPRLARMPNMPW